MKKIWVLIECENIEWECEESYRFLNENSLWKSYQSMIEYITRIINDWGGTPEFETKDGITYVYLVDGNVRELWYYIILLEVNE